MLDSTAYNNIFFFKIIQSKSMPKHGSYSLIILHKLLTYNVILTV